MSLQKLPYVFSSKQDVYPQRGTIVLPVGSPMSRAEDFYTNQTMSTRSSKYSPRVNHPSLTSFTNLMEMEQQTPVYPKKETIASLTSFSDAAALQQSLLTPRHTKANSGAKANEYGFQAQDLNYKRPSFVDTKLVPLLTQTGSKPRQSQFYLQPSNQFASPYLQPNISPAYPTRNPSLLFLPNQSYESKFEERLERQQKLLGNLFNRVEKQIVAEKHERSTSLGLEMRDRESKTVIRDPRTRRPTQRDVMLDNQEGDSLAQLLQQRSPVKNLTGLTGLLYEKTMNKIAKIDEEEENSDASRLNSQQDSRKVQRETGLRKHNTDTSRRINTIVSFKDHYPRTEEVTGYYTQRGPTSGHYDDPSPRVGHQSHRSIDGSQSRLYYQRAQAQPQSLISVNSREQEEESIMSTKSVVRPVSKKKVRKSCIIKPADSKIQKRIQVKKKLRMVGWAMAYYFLLYNKVKVTVLKEKEELLVNMSQNINFITNSLEFYIMQTAGKHIQEMVTDKKHSFIFASEKQSSSKKIEKDCQGLFAHLKTIMSKLFENTKTISVVLFDKLAKISEEGSLLPNDYFSDYELKRQQFSYFGKLKFMSPAKSKMIIAGIVLRVLLQKIIMKPCDVFKIDPKKINHEKLLNIGSVIYNLIMEVLTNLGPAFQNNQKFLCVELRIKPKKIVSKALELEDTPILKPVKDTSRDGDIIEGYYSRQQLSCFFKDRTQMVDELKSSLYAWLDSMYDMSHARASKNSKQS